MKEVLAQSNRKLVTEEVHSVETHLYTLLADQSVLYFDSAYVHPIIYTLLQSTRDSYETHDKVKTHMTT